MQWGELERRTVPTPDGSIALRTGGTGPPLLLLHGFPQTHRMWRDVAPLLAEDFTVVCADLRGYGESGCPARGVDGVAYSKRAMAKEMTQVMSELGFDTFAVVGHDRGARVAYRLALDHPERASALVALDVVPIDAAWERADSRLALGFWPWSMLAQEAPLPERLLLGAAEAVLDGALGGWGTPPAVFDDGVRAAYLDQLRDPDHVRAICEEYRAAATIDPSHDAEDRAAGRRIPCPVRVLGAVKGRLAAGTPRTEVRSSSGRVCASGWRGNPSPAATSSRRSIPPPLPRTSAISWVERHPSVEARATRGEIPRGATPGPMRPYVAFDRHEISFVPGGGLRVRLAHRTLSGLPAKFQ